MSGRRLCRHRDPATSCLDAVCRMTELNAQIVDLHAELAAARSATPAIRGFRFHQGPEITRPIPFDWTMSWPKVDEARHSWAEAIDEAVRYEDAWGLLCTRPDGDVTLRDCLTPGATWEATSASAVHLLLAREAR